MEIRESIQKYMVGINVEKMIGLKNKNKKREEKKGRRKKKKRENSTELQKANVEAEVYNNNKKM